ncbi:uncharacterized protein PRCAT00002175001 [Priceomyces carsonii]|uniref:uncharacterized protein n=1 Tax=Priceomyces carsonii TaxID=28549 RepID=UPI002EDA561F|nr:unnamed protein product [Priceomyces carsonii]
MVSAAFRKKAENYISLNPYLMISKSWCPDCHYAYRIWERYNARDKVYIIELDKFEDVEEAKQLEEAFAEIAGRKWVPTIFFNGKVFGTEEDLKRLENEGKLTQVLKDANLF